ncbi:hypothetical protein TIFTF001_040239 [Ficus carica]|uniref:Uncharacterized protein n=2 Tax=Ficus carica TaxID=3494 RepID=A0AA87Z6J0_FICCA|nr:hypothetical protein TIFTF001_040239 [Ficus carica]
MKAYLILCFLLAFLLFFPSSLVARELAADAGKGQPATGSANKPAKPCGHTGRGEPYCKGVKPGPHPNCGKYTRNPRCRPPNSGP